jgi:hypothetical protein
MVGQLVGDRAGDAFLLCKELDCCTPIWSVWLRSGASTTWHHNSARTFRSRPLKVGVKRDVCIGVGNCASAAPDVFDQDDDGLGMR